MVFTRECSLGSFREAVDAIEIEQRSPKGIATVRVVRQNETWVTLSPSARTSFDDVTIAEDIEEALREAWSAATDAYDELAAQYMRELPVPVDDNEATDAVLDVCAASSSHLSGFSRQFIPDWKKAPWQTAVLRMIMSSIRCSPSMTTSSHQYT